MNALLKTPRSPLTVGEMALNAAPFQTSQQPRTTLVGKDSIGQFFEVGDTVVSKGKLYEVKTIFLDNGDGLPIEDDLYCVLNLNNNSVFNYDLDRIMITQHSAKTIEIEAVDPSWVPPYMGLITHVGVNHYNWIGRYITPLIAKDFQIVRFQSIRVQATLIDDNSKGRKVSLNQRNIVALVDKPSRSQIVQYNKSLKPLLTGHTVSIAK